jgi:hypothetical protein
VGHNKSLCLQKEKKWGIEVLPEGRKFRQKVPIPGLPGFLRLFWYSFRWLSNSQHTNLHHNQQGTLQGMGTQGMQKGASVREGRGKE